MMMSESPKTINRTEYYMKDTTRSGISALLTTGISLAANYGFNLSPDTIRLLASFTPVINQCVNRVLGIFEHRSLARIECARLGICYTQMASTIERNHNNGRGIGGFTARHSIRHRHLIRGRLQRQRHRCTAGCIVQRTGVTPRKQCG